jgi:hypothetical protein
LRIIIGIERHSCALELQYGERLAIVPKQDVSAGVCFLPLRTVNVDHRRAK